MTRATVPIAGPWITQKEIDYVAEAVTTAWYADAGTYVRRFEEAFAGFAGRRHALALPSCTSGLHLALAGLGVGAGDEVIVPDATWIASSAPISYVGATPVFADIERDSWCLSAESFRENITERTKAVIVVDLYGAMPEMDKIIDIASEHGVAVIEDAAEAVGGVFDGRPAGSFGLASTFSFHGSKTLTTGEGGIVLTDDDHLFERMAILRDHGRSPGDYSFFNQEIAFKYRMTDLQAALGLAQLERISELVLKKREIFRWYEENLRDLNAVTLNSERQGTTNAYWMVTAILAESTGLFKEEVIDQLANRGVACRPFFHPLSSLPPYRETPEAERARRENEVAYGVCPRGLNLPSALRLSEQDVDRVCGALRDVIGVSK